LDRTKNDLFVERLKKTMAEFGINDSQKCLVSSVLTDCLSYSIEDMLSEEKRNKK